MCRLTTWSPSYTTIWVFPAIQRNKRSRSGATLHDRPHSTGSHSYPSSTQGRRKVNMIDIEKELQSVFRETFSDPNLVLGDETSAEDIAEWDSASHITLIFTIED